MGILHRDIKPVNLRPPPDTLNSCSCVESKSAKQEREVDHGLSICDLKTESGPPSDFSEECAGIA